MKKNVTHINLVVLVLTLVAVYGVMILKNVLSVIEMDFH